MVPNLTAISKAFFALHNQSYDLSTNEGCGKYTETFVTEMRMTNNKVFHLKKNPGQTQYNGHANDTILYKDALTDFNLYSAVDIIGNAEQHKPWLPTPGGNEPPLGQWIVDIPRYTDADLMLIGSTPNPTTNKVPWVSYDEKGFQQLKNLLAFDYGRRPQNADFDVSVWAARVFHSAYMGPEKNPLGFDAALTKHRPEWCAALGVPVIPFP